MLNIKMCVFAQSEYMDVIEDTPMLLQGNLTRSPSVIAQSDHFYDPRFVTVDSDVTTHLALENRMLHDMCFYTFL